MNILITGGAGYIGSHAVKMLKHRGYNVVVVDNLSTGFAYALDESLPFYEVSTHDTTALIDIFKNERIDAVMHFAAYSLVGESVQEPLKYYHNNVEGTRSLLEAMLRSGVNHLIFSSTAAVYGEQKKMPIRETAPLQPTNPYGATKKTIEDMLRAVNTAHKGFNYASLRYFNVAGAYHDHSIGENHDPETHLIPNVIKSVLSEKNTLKVFGTDYDTKDGSAIRDYIHVEDLIDAHIKALNHIVDHRVSDVFNLGSAEGYSVLDIIKTTETVLNKTVPFEKHQRRPGDPPVLIATHDKAEEVLGWRPTYKLEDMIRSAAHYYEKRR